MRPMTITEKVALQQVILPVLASAPAGRLKHLGSAFVVATLGRQALFMTAAHVVREAVRLEGRRSKHHSTTPPEFLTSKDTKELLQMVNLYVNYRENETKGHLANIAHIYINGPSDIALMAAEFGPDIPENVLFISKLAIDSSPPKIGIPIIAAGYGDSKMDLSTDSNTGLGKARFKHKLDYRHGNVIESLGRNDPSFRFGPGFRIDTAISSGMSGGPVLNKNYGDQIVACGINASDISLIDSSENSGSGVRATCHALWPAMAITIEHAKIDSVEGPARFLELVKRGFVSDLGNPTEHINDVPEPGVKEFSISWT